LLLGLNGKIMKMAEFVFHSDVLPHNFIYDESSQSLHLVDFDEGTPLDGKVPRRILNFELEDPWFKALLYPNALWQAGK